MVNEELRAIVRELNRELSDNIAVQVRYSDAFSDNRFESGGIAAPDRWMAASVEGHNVLAEAAFRDLDQVWNFLDS